MGMEGRGKGRGGEERLFHSVLQTVLIKTEKCYQCLFLPSGIKPSQKE